MKKQKLEDWILDWHNLFPLRKETQTSGYLLGKPEECVNKMKKFCKNNKLYTKDIIFAATQMYLQEKKNVNYTYLSRPIYFIDKLGRGSILAEYCERILANEKPDTTKNEFKYEYNPVNEFL